MFDAPNCGCCGKKEAKNGQGCNNPDCKEYYKRKESCGIMMKKTGRIAKGETDELCT